MKKIIAFLALIITCSGASLPVSAHMTKNDTTWWTVEELLEFYQEVEAERTAECGDNQDCKNEYNLNLIEKGPKYSALNNLIEMQFWVTSINPATETIKVLFFDDEMSLRFMGVEEKLSLEHLYIGWFDNWTGQIYNYNHEQFTNGTVAGVHTLYDSEQEDLGLIEPWQEIELSVVGGELSNNTSGKLDYAIFANYYNAEGYFDYSSCLSDTDYDGSECKMYISGDQWISYFPPREDELENDTSESIQDTNEELDVENEPIDTIADETISEPTNEAIDSPTDELLPVDNESSSVNDPEDIEAEQETIVENSTNDIEVIPKDEPTNDEPKEQLSLTPEPTVKISTSLKIEAEEHETVTGFGGQEPAKLAIENPSQVFAVASKEEQSKSSISSPLTPNTGKPNSSEKKTREGTELLVFFLLVGLVLIIWWIIPTRSRKEQKKYKKSIDKKHKLR